MHIDAVGQQVRHAGLLPGDHRLEQVAHLQNANNVVHRPTVDRDTGKMRLQHRTQRLFERVLHIDGHQVNAWGENLLDADLVEFKRRLDQLAFGFFQHAFLFDRFDNVFEFLLGHRRLRVGTFEHAQSEFLDLDEDEYDRREQPDEKPEQPARLHCNRFAVFLGQRFWQDFPEDQHQNGHHHSGYRHTGVSEILREYNGCQRRRGDIYDIVSDQYRGKQTVVALRLLQYQRRSPVTARRHVF